MEKKIKNGIKNLKRKKIINFFVYSKKGANRAVPLFTGQMQCCVPLGVRCVQCVVPADQEVDNLKDLFCF